MSSYSNNTQPWLKVIKLLPTHTHTHTHSTHALRGSTPIHCGGITTSLPRHTLETTGHLKTPSILAMIYQHTNSGASPYIGSPPLSWTWDKNNKNNQNTNTHLFTPMTYNLQKHSLTLAFNSLAYWFLVVFSVAKTTCERRETSVTLHQCFNLVE